MTPHKIRRSRMEKRRGKKVSKMGNRKMGNRANRLRRTDIDVCNVLLYK